MSQLSSEEINKIIIDTLAPFGVLRISIFGSFSRNQQTAKSDLDILVLLPPINNRKLIGLKWFTLDQELERKLGRPVDIVSENALFNPLKYSINQDLKVIYEKAG